MAGGGGGDETGSDPEILTIVVPQWWVGQWGGGGGRRRREGNGDSVKISTATRDGGIMQMSGWEIFRWNQSNKNESTDGSISE